MSGQFLPPARVNQIVRTYLLSFFNKYLKGEDDHLLDAPSPAYPEVVQLLSASSLSSPPKHPKAGLVQGSDGNFYGTTEYGGASGDGTVFQVTPAGALTILVSFNRTNGSHPAAGLVQGNDGNFYGTPPRWRRADAEAIAYSVVFLFHHQYAGRPSAMMPSPAMAFPN